MTIDISRPLALLLIPVAAALLAFTFNRIKTRSLGRKITYTAVRGAVLLLLILALSGINIKLRDKYTATVFLLDVSDSVRNSRSDMISFVNEAVKTKQKYDSVAIIAFGDGSAVEQFLSQTPSFNEFQSTVTRSATNIENAVLTGLSMIPEGYAGRIVLLTDGLENAGNVKNTISSLVTGKALLEVKTFNATNEQEVYVSNLKVPQDAGIGENFVITVEIESNVNTRATINLYSGRTLKGRREVALTPGKNTFAFTDTWTEEGLKTYRVLLEAENDTVSVNNEYLAYTNISVEKPLLVIEGKAGQSLELSKILDALGANYEIRQPLAAPDSISELNEFSAVIFVDVYAKDLRKGFTENLESFVKDFGGGFICTGGKNSYALGGYDDTPIETVLPVSMELQGENEIPTIAMMMVIDHSGSMSDGNGAITNLDLAKESALAALDNLRSTDYVGVIAFDDSYDRVVPLQKVGNRESAIKGISSIQIAGGTSIYPAVAAAARELSGCDAAVKHIVLLTDGQDSYDFSNYASVIQKVVAEGITLSSVSIGEGSNSLLLSQLADACDGRYYYTDINSDLPRIFAQEVFLSVNAYLVNREFTPLCASDPLINDVTAEGLPSLLGYVATTAKPRANLLMTSDTTDPILCCWQYGLGKTVAFTSDVTGSWSRNYSGWDKFRDLWHNLIDYVTSVKISEGAYAEVIQEGSVATVRYVTEDYGSSTRISATIADDNGETKELALDPITPGIYTASFEMSEKGVYSISIKQYEGEEVTNSINTAAIMQYSLEYRFYELSTVLAEFVKTAGGNMITEASEVFNEELDLVKRQSDISTPLLVAAVILFMFDIAIRRFRFDFSALKPVFAKKSAEKKEEAGEKPANEKPLSEKAMAKQLAREKKEAEKKLKKEQKKKDDENRKDPPPSTANRLDTAELMRNLRR